jgi:hypothetical protein
MPRELSAIAMKALAKDRAQRYQSVEVMDIAGVRRCSASSAALE